MLSAVHEQSPMEGSVVKVTVLVHVNDNWNPMSPTVTQSQLNVSNLQPCLLSPSWALFKLFKDGSRVGWEFREDPNTSPSKFKIYIYSDATPFASDVSQKRIKALLHKERTWPKNLSGSGMVRQDDETLFFSGNS